MESTNGRAVPCLPFVFDQLPTSFLDFALLESKGNPSNSVDSFHQRCSSDSVLLEEQPSWLDDLLNDSESQVLRAHRHSASDTYTYLGQAVETFNLRDKSICETKTCLLEEKNNKESNIAVSTSAEEQNIEVESGALNLEGSTEKANGSQAKPSAPKIDAKRAKQNTGQRSRVRKFQYIGQLERTIQFLQAEGCEVTAEVDFLEQHNTILAMENKALRQRLESLSQELLIKHLEQEMLRREIGRMQTLFQLQKQQPMLLQHQLHSKQHRNKA